MDHKPSLTRVFSGPITALVLLTTSWPSISLAQQESAHQRDYRAALAVVQQAPERLSMAMEDIQSGAIAHYDFLQFEHTELIRHARALAWPPAQTSSAERDAIRQEADALLASADALEWVIADFLRAMAQVRIASSNTLDIIALVPPQNPAAKTLSTLQSETEAFVTAGYRTDTGALYAAYDAALQSALPERALRELSFQRTLLEQGVPQLQRQHDALLASDIASRAEHLADLYQASL